MDLGVRTPPGVNSIRHDEEHLLHSPNPCRKRKLQLEQQALPLSKHKFPQHCSSSSKNSSDRGSPTSHYDLVPNGSSEDSVDETETDPELHVGAKQREGSSSNGGGGGSSSSSSSLLFEGSASTMALDPEGHVGTSTRIFVPHLEPTASAGSHEGIASKDSLYFLEGRTGENSKDSGYQLPTFGADDGDNNDLPASELDELMKEECSHGPMEELMLSCDDVGLHTLVLSSAKWNIKQDALPGAGRPTIDQEFEQYFSTFMF